MKNYFCYLPETPHAAFWGCAATSAGFTRIPPGSPYPPQRHPGDHHFTWERGRILQAYQFVLISEGGGLLETDTRRKSWQLSAGSLFVLFPGIWHRYAPDPKSGWVEHWLECRGPAFDQATKSGLISPDQLLFDTADDTALHESFARIHSWAFDDALAHQDLLSTLGLHLLARLAYRHRGDEGRDAIARMVRRGQTLIMDRADEPLNVEAIASELRVGYSHFRQAFKDRTGLSPKQYHQQMRIRRAQDFLANTDQTAQQIAELLGFSTAFHFSKQFKDTTGHPPSAWRERTRIHAGQKAKFTGKPKPAAKQRRSSR